MLEMLINPKRAEKKPWEMFFIGLIYASLSVLLVGLIGDSIGKEYTGWILVMFCVIFSMPFMYYLIKLEEEKEISEKEGISLLKEHGKAIMALLWLFLGFIIAFSFWYIVLPGGAINFQPQIEVFCRINNPGNFEECVTQYLPQDFTGSAVGITGNMSSMDRLLAIFANNIYVLIFTLIFSLIFGAGALFILAWNASVIAAAIGIFTKSNLAALPIGMMRYMIHGLPEIAAYFIAALAGGILSIAVIKRDTAGKNFWKIFQDSLSLIVIAIIILLISAIIEVFITPILF